MFYAMEDGKMDLGGYRFEYILQDIQTLNERATRGELHITAISIHAYAYVLDKYALLPSGASMGDGYGPLLITTSREGLREGASDDEVREWLKGRRIAIPGKMTSAYLALLLYLGVEPETVVVPFDEIFAHVREGKSPVGLIIHEGQVTYERDGFLKIRDFGEWWKEETGLPLPLGGNVIRKDIPPETRSKLNVILRESIRYGLEHRAAGVAHALPHARDMGAELADKFIGMYVNDYTLDYGEAGRESIRLFFERAAAGGWIPAPVELEFVD